MSKGKILKQHDAVPYKMPTLEDERCGTLLVNHADEIQRMAYEEGFSAGEKAGYAEGEQKVLLLIERLNRMIEEVALFKKDISKTLESKLVELATAIAKKVINDEISARPEIMVGMVREGLKRLQRIGTITIKINPALYEIFMKSKKQLLDIHPEIVFDVNAGVPLTGPLVVSNIEEVVTDIESLLANVVDNMKSVKRTAEPEKDTRTGSTSKVQA